MQPCVAIRRCTLLPVLSHLYWVLLVSELHLKKRDWKYLLLAQQVPDEHLPLVDDVVQLTVEELAW